MEGQRISGMEYDHFIPFALGGASDLSNVQLACYECNRKKWHAHPNVVFGPDWEDWAPGKPRPAV
ncbi:MAG: HNH endonuclease [Chloroflexia bacterium]|nr:HNH endonuclease [Chloroflexia bacterium]